MSMLMCHMEHISIISWCYTMCHGVTVWWCEYIIVLRYDDLMVWQGHTVTPWPRGETPWQTEWRCHAVRKWLKRVTSHHHVYMSRYDSVTRCVTVYHEVSQCITKCHGVSRSVMVYHEVSRCITKCHGVSRSITVSCCQCNTHRWHGDSDTVKGSGCHYHRDSDSVRVTITIPVTMTVTLSISLSLW